MKIVQCSLAVIEASAVFYCKLMLTVRHNSASLIPADDAPKITGEVGADLRRWLKKMDAHLNLSRQL